MRYVSPMSMPKATTLESSESVTVIDGGVAVAVQRGDRSRQIPARWLRLLASDSANVDPVSGQRAYESVALPSMIRVRSASFCEEQGGWEVRFEGETSPVLIEVDRLLGCEETEEIKGPERIPFSSADQAMRAVDYENLEAPAALRSFLGTLFRCGYARVRDVPANEKELARFAKRLGHIGGSSGLSTFDEVVAAGDASGNNSSRGSAPHTDGAFRDPVPSFHVQLCVKDSTESGGDVYVVDGMTAAATLAAEAPVAAAELARWPMLFRYRDAKSDLRRAVPLFETGPDGALQRITFDDRAAVDFICPDERLAICADAYDQLARIVLREGLQNRFRMQVGDLLVTDNERVLHGRRPVTGAGTRQLACCYLDRCDLLSTWRRARSGELD